MSNPYPVPVTQFPIGKPQLKFFSERYGGRPYVNCLVCAALVPLVWAGYDVPDDGMLQLRQAMNVPIYRDGSWTGHRNAAGDWVGDKAEGKPQGTWSAAIRRGLRVVVPHATVNFGPIADADLIAALPRVGRRNRHRAVFAVSVDCEKLPRYLRRLVGYSYTGLHGVAIARNFEDGTVLYLDPMGRTARPKNAAADWQPYAGQVVPFADIAPALQRGTNDAIKAIWAYKRTAA